MDATTNKTLSGFLVTLMLGAVFLSAVPAATATHLSTGGSDITIDVRTQTNAPQTVTVYNGTDITFSNIMVPTSPAGAKIYHSTAYELTLIGINITAGMPSGTQGYAGSTANLEIINASSGAVAAAGTPLTQGPDGAGSCTANMAPGCLRNATFIIQPGTTTTCGTFCGPGLYLVRPVGATNDVARIAVYPKEDISVTVAPTSVTYTAGSSAIIGVTTGTSGALLSSSAPNSFISGSQPTDGAGSLTFVSTLPQGAGVWPIFATRDTNPATSAGFATASQCNPTNVSCNAATYACADIYCNSLPERTGNTTLTVAATILTRTAGLDAAFVGFANTVSSIFKAPATGNAVAKTGFADFTVTGFNLTIVTPSNFQFVLNTTNFSNTWPPVNGTFTSGNWRCQNVADGWTMLNSCGSVTPPTVTVNPTDGTLNIVIDTWQSGTYTATLGLEVAGGPATAPEYVGTWSIPVTSPAAVNVETAVSTVDVPAPTQIPISSATLSSAQGTVSLAVTISGDTIYRHPLCDKGPANASCGDAVGFGTWETDTSFIDNITLSGAVLPGWNVTSYTATSGVANLRFTPTANGTIWVNVAWKNTTTSKVVPVYRGANITLDVSNITVDTTSNVVATVRDAQGNPQSAAKVFAFPRQTITATSPTPLTDSAYQGTGSAVVLGTGGAGAGQNGQYTFTLKPSAVQDLVFVAEIGSTGNLNYTYAPLTVLPNLDLTTTLNVTETMAALRTQVVLNVTNTTGEGQVSNPNNFRAYFLTGTQRTNLLVNGTTALFTTGVVPTAATVTGSSANGTVTNVSLNAGDYHVYVCSSTTTITDCRTAIRDNRNNMPLFNVSAYTAMFNPTQIANNPDIQGATAIHVMVKDRAGVLVNGSLSVRTNGTLTTSGASFSTTVTNGEANITLTGANTGIGNVEWDFNPKEATGSDDSAKDRVIGVLEIVAGNLTFQPSKVSILQSTLVTVRLTNFTGAGLAGRVIRLCGSSVNSNWPASPATNANPPTTLTGADITNCPAVASTEADGTTGIVLTPTSLNAVHVYVNNSYTGRTIAVTAGALTVTVSPIAPKAGDNVTFTVQQPGGTASVGSQILVTKDGATVLDTTADGSGKAVLRNVSAGDYTVTGIRSGFDNGTATFTVGPADTPVCTPSFTLDNLVIPSTVSVGTPVTVSVNVANTATCEGTATALLLVNNAQRDSLSVPLGAGEQQNVAYTFTPTVAGTYAVSVRIGTTTVGPQNIVVGTPDVTPTATPTATATPTPSATPTATPSTTPSASPTTPVTSTPTATTESPRVPGFEVVALIGALGIAMLVLRRRN